FFLLVPPPPRSTLFPTRRSSDLPPAARLRPEPRPGHGLAGRGGAAAAGGADLPRRRPGRRRLAARDPGPPRAGRAEGELRRRLRSEEHTSELQSRENLVCRLLLE